MESCHRDTGACEGACPAGKYGTHCMQTCSQYCQGGCVKSSGDCSACIDGRYGNLCTETCGAGCVSGCDQFNGNCTCNTGWEGNRCEGMLNMFQSLLSLKF